MANGLWRASAAAISCSPRTRLAAANVGNGWPKRLPRSLLEPIANPSGSGTMRLWPRIALMRTVKGEGADAMFGRLAETLARAQQRTGRRLAVGRWRDDALPGAAAPSSMPICSPRSTATKSKYCSSHNSAPPSDRLVGAEALARWQHPGLGRIGAGALFAIAERADHVAQLSHHIAERALKAAPNGPLACAFRSTSRLPILPWAAFANEIASVLTDDGLRSRAPDAGNHRAGFACAISIVAARTLARAGRPGHPHRARRFRRGILQFPLSEAAAAALPQARPLDDRRHR